MQQQPESVAPSEQRQRSDLPHIIIANACGFLCCIAGIVKVVFFALYAFDNPDREAWYGLDLQTGQPKLFESENGASMDTELDDIHGRITSWLLWGFMMFITPVFLSMTVLAVALVSPLFSRICGSLTLFIFGASYIAWYISGILWRFNKEGSFACGDFLSDEEFEKERNLFDETGGTT